MNNNKELQDIKRLLMLFLIKAGTTSEEIGYALGIDSSVVRKMLPIKKIKKFKEQGNKSSKSSKAKEEEDE